MYNFILEQLDRVLYVNTSFTFKDAYKLYSSLTRYAERYERRTFYLLSDLVYVMENSPNIRVIAYAIQTVLLDSLHDSRTTVFHETKYHIEKNIYAFYIALNSWDDDFLENTFTHFYNCKSKSTGWLASLKYQYLPRYGL